MGATRSPAVTGLPEQSFQLEHPSSEAIWKRAVEVFGNEELARKWLDTHCRFSANPLRGSFPPLAMLRSSVRS